jgi:tetratricopeptide (TPR) repeat protein
MSATDNYAFEKAMIDYKKGDYPAAIQAWDSLKKRQPANDTLNYFLGAAHLANKNHGQAVTYLKSVTASATSFFKGDAYWYLGLALLKEGKTEEARAAIQQSTNLNKKELLKKMQ